MNDEALKPQMPELLAGPAVGITRLAVGLLQGLILYLLYRASQGHTWPATEPLLFVPLLLVALLAPVILISTLGHAERRQILTWVGTSAAIIAALAVYDIWRVSDVAAPVPFSPASQPTARTPWPSAPLWLCLVAGFFIAHSLVMAGLRDRRRIASYFSHFEIAWKLLIQLAFSAAFVGAVWLSLHLGAELFQLINLRLLKRLLEESWFVIPVVAFAFSCAMHLTDVRPQIVHGIRSLLLTLMSWVLPVITLIVGIFILSLPVTGLQSLWATRHATSVLLVTAAAFVVLINAAYQDGSAETAVARVIRMSAAGASLLLVPIVAIAIHALGLRVGDYGWTSDRIIAAACLLVASCYAVGYAAAVPRRARLTISTVNIGAAFVVLATLLLLLSPVADPARLSVIDQVARLSSGKVAADKFDFSYLRFEGARYGRDALARLDATANGKDGAVVRQRIAAARMNDRYTPAREELAPHAFAANLVVWPEGTRLPESFLQSEWTPKSQEWPRLPGCLRLVGKACDAYLLDLSGDGKPEIVLIGAESGGGAAVLGENAGGQWRMVGDLPHFVAGCASMRKSLIDGKFRAVERPVQDLDISGRRIPIRTVDGETSGSCPPW